jgi:hypothetical protein
MDSSDSETEELYSDGEFSVSSDSDSDDSNLDQENFDPNRAHLRTTAADKER